MIKKGEELKAEDEKYVKKIEMKNKLESYTFNWSSQLEEAELKKNIGSEYEPSVKLVNETKKWIEANQEASFEEYEDKYKEIETYFNTLMQKFNQPSDTQTQAPQETVADVD
jgi:heat shock protein 1/8